MIDMDLLYMAYTGNDIYDKPQNIFSFIRDMYNHSIDRAAGRDFNTWVIGGFPESFTRNKLIQEYKMKEVFIDSTKSQCYRHIAGDKRRKFDDWKWIIDKWFQRYEKENS